MRIVQKFGGSSLADRDCLLRAAGLILEAARRGQHPVAVVSAAGDSTDELITQAFSLCPHPSPRELDALLATGEQRSAALMAITLQGFGVSARSFSGWQAGLYTEESHGDARVTHIEPERLLRAMEAGEIPVVAGFQGLTPLGEVSTLGRGGSDTTAVALAAALKADRCEIYTDVDGIYTADPRLVPEARLLPAIDRRDMLALAEGGSQVLHAESLRVAALSDQELRLLSTFTGSPGTLVRLLPEGERPALAGVTRDAEKHTVTLAGRAAPDCADAALSALRGAGIEALPAASGENDLRFAVRPGQELDALRLLHGML